MIVAFALTAASVPWIALAVAIATFVATQREVRRRAKVDYVNQLEDRNKNCLSECLELRSECVELRKQVSTLKDENFQLMRRIADIEHR
jgi:hypothetical protein